MIEIPYDLIIEATEEPDFFGFYSPELEGFSGIGHSVEDCLYQARWGMREHIELLAEKNMPLPPRNESATVLIRNMRRAPLEQETRVEAVEDNPAIRQDSPVS
jgi:predicted RNase H-like HicB family nuclease